MHQGKERILGSLKKYLSQHKISAHSISRGKIKNPFPIGNRAVYSLYLGKSITDSHLWKMQTFFIDYESKEQEIREMIEDICKPILVKKNDDTTKTGE